MIETVKNRIVMILHGEEVNNIPQIAEIMATGGYVVTVGSIRSIGSVSRLEFEQSPQKDASFTNITHPSEPTVNKGEVVGEAKERE